MSSSQDYSTGSEKVSSAGDSTVDVSSPYTPRRPSPIVSISINHPIGTLLRKIKNFFVHKQTLFSTTFSIKVTPIVALVSLLGVAAVFGGGITTAYTFGKTVEQRLLASLSPTPSTMQSPASPIPKPVTVSLAGIIKATYSLPSQIPTPFVIPNDVPRFQEASPLGGNQSNSEIASSSTSPRNDEVTLTPLPTHSTSSGLSVLHYVLVSRNGSINYLVPSSSVLLQNYLNLNVVITGVFDSNKNTLFISKPENIEIL